LLAAEPFCRLTTTGRVTGRARTIEIWFALHGTTVYFLSGGGGRANWVRNLLRDPAAQVRIAGETFAGSGRVVADAAEAGLARRLLLAKYGPGYGGDLSGWGRTALPVAVDLEVAPGRRS
jgi:deazaflavin-dependent oxidoreductase (nitroreductase family)